MYLFIIILFGPSQKTNHLSFITCAHNIRFCLVNGQWTIWSGYEACSETCGDGIKSKRRNCTEPVPQYGGDDCEGDSTEEATCKVEECPSMFNLCYSIIFPLFPSLKVLYNLISGT